MEVGSSTSAQSNTPLSKNEETPSKGLLIALEQEIKSFNATALTPQPSERPSFKIGRPGFNELPEPGADEIPTVTSSKCSRSRDLTGMFNSAAKDG